MKKLTINWDELSGAPDNTGLEISYFLDTDTGRVLVVTAEDQHRLQEMYGKVQEEEALVSFDLELALAESGLPDWQQDGVRTADFVETHFGVRAIAIPQEASYVGYDVMLEFIATVENSLLRNQLSQATRGSGAFRRFRHILSEHIAEEERWYAFEENRHRRQIADWLAEVGIEPIDPPELMGVDEEASIKLRNRLLDEVALFVQVVSQIPSVSRIALIGSLTTDKPDPKDADILVTVTDTHYLARLAEQGAS